MKRNILTSALLAVSVLSINAAPKEHVIERGETIETIAAKYGISPETIKEANPDIAELFFTGMVLQIPDSASGQNKTDTEIEPYDHSSSGGDPSQQESTQYTQEKNPQINNRAIYVNPDNERGSGNQTYRDNETTADDFGGISAYYCADVEHFQYGMYGLRFDGYYGGKGLGFSIAFQMSFGLQPKGEYGEIAFLFGPQYGYALNEHILIGGRLRGCIGTATVITKSKTFHNYYQGEDQVNTSKGNKIGGGMYVTPHVSFKFGRFYVDLGYNLGFYTAPYSDFSNPTISNDEIKYDIKTKTDFSHNLELSLGFHF